MNITTKSKKAKREITLEIPDILTCRTVAELVGIQGETLCHNQIMNQLKVAFRAKIKGFLEAKKEDGTFKHTDNEINKMDFVVWRPKLQVTKSPQDKIDAILNALPPKERKEVLARYNALKEKK